MKPIDRPTHVAYPEPPSDQPYAEDRTTDDHPSGYPERLESEKGAHRLSPLVLFTLLDLGLPLGFSSRELVAREPELVFFVCEWVGRVDGKVFDTGLVCVGGGRGGG
jgi:hypothetical protein